MEEIPTMVLDPMPSSLLEHGDYVVLNRPYAVSAAQPLPPEQKTKCVLFGGWIMD